MFIARMHVNTGLVNRWDIRWSKSITDSWPAGGMPLSTVDKLMCRFGPHEVKQMRGDDRRVAPDYSQSINQSINLVFASTCARVSRWSMTSLSSTRRNSKQLQYFGFIRLDAIWAQWYTTHWWRNYGSQPNRTFQHEFELRQSCVVSSSCSKMVESFESESTGWMIHFKSVQHVNGCVDE